MEVDFYIFGDKIFTNIILNGIIEQKRRSKAMERNEKDIEQLIELSQNEKRVKQKLIYDAVLLFLEGYTRGEISKILHEKQGTVNHHIRKYINNGIEDLHIKKQPGYQKRLTDEQETELAELITSKTPEEAGMGVFANWTAPLICCLVEKKYSVKYSERGMRDLLERIGLSYTRPTYTLAKANPQKQEEFKEKFKDLKKN